MMGTKSKKQNILIVHNYYQIPGGEDTVVENEKRMLEEHGHKVILYTRNNAELKRMSKLRKLFLPVTTVFNPKSYKEIKQLIKKENIEVVHVHNTLNLVSGFRSDGTWSSNYMHKCRRSGSFNRYH